jgi:hypothetical protein
MPSYLQDFLRINSLVWSVSLLLTLTGFNLKDKPLVVPSMYLARMRPFRIISSRERLNRILSSSSFAVSLVISTY